MSNFSKQENRLKLSRIDYVIIICYSVITFLSFILDHPIVYLFLGLVMLGVYLYKITKAPANVLSLSLLAGHPFSYTLANTNIPLLSASTIIVLNIFALVIYFMRGGHLKLSTSKVYVLVGLFFLFVLLVIKWVQADYSLVGFEMLYYFIGFGLLSNIIILFVIKDLRDIIGNFKITLIIFASYILAIFYIFIYKSDPKNFLYGLENPIGMSYFIITNMLLLLFVVPPSNKIFKIFVIILSVLITLLLGQRSFLVGMIFLGAIYFFKLYSSLKIKFGVLCGVVIVVSAFALYYEGIDNYKLNYFSTFLSDPMYYLNKVQYVSFEAAHEQLGTIGSRFYMWYLAVTSANPLIGNGLGDFYTLTGDIAKYPHNIFVEFYFLFGIGGLFASILFFYKSLKYAIRTLSKVHIFRFVNSDIIIMFPILMFSSSVTGLLCNYITFVILQIMVLQKLKEYEYTDY